MALTVFKSINSLNPPCLNDIFSKKSVPYRMRDSYIIEQPKRRTTTFGLILFSYVGTRVWNELPTYLKETADLNDFKSLFNTWNGPDLVIQHSLICDILGFMSTTLYNLVLIQIIKKWSLPNFVWTLCCSVWCSPNYSKTKQTRIAMETPSV